MNNKYQAFFIVVTLWFVAAEANAYKFLCNGMDARRQRPG